MEFEFSDIYTQTFLLRTVHSIFILTICIELFRSAYFIDNHRIVHYIWKIAFFFLGYFIARIVAGVLDSHLLFDIGWFSNLTTIVFWAVIVWKARRIRVILSSPKNNEHRISLRTHLDEIIEQMEQAKKNLQRLKESHTSK